MRMLWLNAGPRAGEAGDGVDAVATDTDAAALYRDDPRHRADGRPWVVVNMVASADGSAIGPEGLSGGLSSPTDKAIFFALRGVADVIVAGSSTVIAEDYGPARPSPEVVDQRRARRQPDRPRIAVVTASLLIDPDRRLFTESPPDARPIVLTTERSDAGRKARLATVADLHAAGGDAVDWEQALAVLAETAGAGVVLCEGGPTVMGQLVAADLIDELCLTITPVVVAGPGPRIARSLDASPPRALALDRVLAKDGHLFLRYLRPPPAP
jgi:riboflavin biosynthesis pyrimidine reductase